MFMYTISFLVEVTYILKMGKNAKQSYFAKTMQMDQGIRRPTYLGPVILYRTISRNLVIALDNKNKNYNEISIG